LSYIHEAHSRRWWSPCKLQQLAGRVVFLSTLVFTYTRLKLIRRVSPTSKGETYAYTLFKLLFSTWKLYFLSPATLQNQWKRGSHLKSVKCFRKNNKIPENLCKSRSNACSLLWWKLINFVVKFSFFYQGMIYNQIIEAWVENFLERIWARLPVKMFQPIWNMNTTSFFPWRKIYRKMVVSYFHYIFILVIFPLKYFMINSMTLNPSRWLTPSMVFSLNNANPNSRQVLANIPSL